MEKVKNLYSTVQVEREKIQKLKMLTFKYGTSLSMVTTTALNEFIEKKENKEFFERFKI